MLAYGLTIFLGAFLLFQVQPLIAKYILPWFGGGPGVWTTCMLFFQLLLLGGYTYAHLLTRKLKPRGQAIVHLILLGAALASLPITPREALKPDGTGNPTLQILLLLTVSLGLPYFVLSATSPLLQQWFNRSFPERSPYRLFALSNAGSLLALISFPFYVEPHFTRRLQVVLWGWGLAAYAVGCTLCALKLRKGSRTEPATVHSPETAALPKQEPIAAAPPGAIQKVLWFLLAACASVLLLATTNKMCLDVAVIPFLWVLPLGLYLLSFIICFDNQRWYMRLPFTLALIIALGAVCWALFKGTDASIYQQVTLYSGGLFVCCMVCHGELFRLRPDPRFLTSFYLLIAAGGAAGGLFVAVAAPILFSNYYELNLGLFLCGLLFLVVCARDQNPISLNHWRWIAFALTLAVFAGLDQSFVWLGTQLKALPVGYIHASRIALWLFLAALVTSWLVRKKFKSFTYWRLLACAWLLLGLCALGSALWKQAGSSGAEIVSKSRNFYGVLTVFEHEKDDPEEHHLLLQHGRITHGLQFVDPKRASWATTYYGAGTGIERAVRSLPPQGRRIGVVGLGTGTLLAYGQAGDYWRIYEINPQVRQLSTSRFTYLNHCPGKVDVAMGDARLSMEREPSQQFDLLALDAFSSDAIPVHLLTKEAFDIYEKHLKTNGIIAVHISNHYLDLEPVVANIAHQFKYQLAMFDYDEHDNEDEWWLYSSTWIVLTHSEQSFLSPSLNNGATTIKTNWARVPLWTDDFASLFQILQK
jgi:hypothetical protein